MAALLAQTASRRTSTILRRLRNAHRGELRSQPASNADGGGSQDGNWRGVPFATFDQLDVTQIPLVLRMVRTCESLNRLVIQHNDPGHDGNALASARSSTSSGSGSGCVAAIS